MRINVSYQAMGMFVATFDDYDGAPDAHDILGHGTSKAKAAEALLERAVDEGRITEQEAHTIAIDEIRSNHE